MLLERQPALDALAALRTQSAREHGRIALVGGEAGIGKTSLLRAFASDALWGACDPLFAPRPLGPLHDVAPALGGRLATALAHDAGRIEVFDALLDALGRDERVLVLEDLHWADEATLDLLAWLGRRIERTRTLLVASYRDDEVGPRHPLRRVLGGLAGLARIVLPRLSEQAVRELAGPRGAEAQALHRISGGNPFFVTELLAVEDAKVVPPTVRDAVLARLAPLPEGARSLLDAAAVLGPRIESALLEAMVSSDIALALDACLVAGVLQESREVGSVEFRHELARQAVLGALTAPRRLGLHRRALQVLRAAPGVDAARVAEHAEAVRDRDAVLEFARLAARQAAAVGARRQTYQQYERALRFADGLPDGERVVLLEAFAFESLAVGERQAGVDARRSAIALRAARGEPRQQAENLCRLTNLLVFMGRRAEADDALRQAFELLQPLPPCREQGYAWRTRAHLSSLINDDAQCIAAADRAITLAEAFGDAETLISALNSKGAALARSDFDAGCAVLERSRRLALEAARPAQVFNADINLGEAAMDACRFEDAERHLAAADALAVERQMERGTTQGRLALCALQLGRWIDAGDLAGRAVAEFADHHLNRALAQLVLGRLRARRGDDGVRGALDEALAMALSTGTLDSLARVRAARAEAAWLAGDAARCRDEAGAAWEQAAAHRHPWFAGELAWWRHVGGEAFDVPGFVAPPFALQIGGDWRGAAAAWGALKCPYEQASALAEGDEAAQREALAIFEGLGARPAAEALRQRLHDAGVRGLARGPRASTRERAFGLTARELQVLQLLCAGLRNAEIAARLHRSVRTVDHHLAAVFAKLGVDSRLAAIQAAQRAGLVQSGQAGRAK